MDYDEDLATQANLFTVGEYFDTFAPKIIKGPIPSMMYDHNQDMDFNSTLTSYRHQILLVAFVKDFDAIFDSTKKMNVS